ncbi:hypothetical protein CHELA1G11_13721 [Hyphomicrobiales bacterium]|nr:hypothetical protein CHELA1G11_13721 [Hyphomicrobiales bacterium]
MRGDRPRNAAASLVRRKRGGRRAVLGCMDASVALWDAARDKRRTGATVAKQRRAESGEFQGVSNNPTPTGKGSGTAAEAQELEVSACDHDRSVTEQIAHGVAEGGALPLVVGDAVNAE